MLGLIGNAALPSLTKGLDDKNEDIRVEVVLALGIMEAAVPALIKAVKDKEPDVRLNAVVSLGRSAQTLRRRSNR